MEDWVAVRPYWEIQYIGDLFNPLPGMGCKIWVRVLDFSVEKTRFDDKVGVVNRHNHM